jgi:hypothetical protein
VSWRGFIESPIFSRLIGDYLTDDEYAGLQVYLLQQPEAGKLVPHSGGVRKLRWALRGRGKRGGIRVIYFVPESSFIWLLTVFSKSEESNIPAHILNKIREAMENA